MQLNPEVKMQNKKSTISIDVMIYMAIGVIVFLVLVLVIPNLLGKGRDQTCGLLSSSKDYDSDGIMDFFDKCPCNQGTEDYDGCSTKDEYKSYTDTAIDDCKGKIEADCKKSK
jgi:hypothetical protein